MLKCPECKINMGEVRTSSHYGIPVVLDQCKNCGGLWFDDNELYRTQHGAAHKLEEKLNISKLRKFTNLENKFLLCPRDEAKLKVFRDRYFPQNIIIDVCHECGGFWLNHGEFTKFQTGRIEKINKIKTKKEQEKKNKELNKELNKKIISVMKLYGELENRSNKKQQRKDIETIVYIIWMLLRIVLKI